MIRKMILSAVVLSAIAGTAGAQQSYDDFRARMNSEYSAFTNRVNKEYDDFRKRINDEYARFLERAWGHHESRQTPIAPPDPEPVVPVVPFEQPDDDPVIDEKPIIIDDVIEPPKPAPAPEPVKPIQEQPIEEERIEFMFYGTPMYVRWSEDNQKFRVSGVDEKSIAAMWQTLSAGRYNNLIYDCLNLRKRYGLGDWYYLKMLQCVCNTICGAATNESTMLMAYIYCQSGYKMRLAENGGRLVMLYASRHLLYDHPYFEMDGVKFYPFDCTATSLYISSASFMNEQPLSLLISDLPNLKVKYGSSKLIKSSKYDDMEFSIAINENLMDYYADYPTSEIGGDLMTRWAMYANTPLSDETRSRLYPFLKRTIGSIGPVEAVSKILDWIQTGLVYEYDDKVWGHDRAFFAEETLHYPYADCEDRAILFSRIVRDLLGLDVLLVYYPGHLAAAVSFGQNVRGDYIDFRNKRYTVCDPTYIGAPIGATMPGMDNASAKIILLGPGES